jgi:hypothetical protein
MKLGILVIAWIKRGSMVAFSIPATLFLFPEPNTIFG